MTLLRLPRRTGLILGALVILGSFGYLVYGLGSNLVYYHTPTELMARGEAAYDAPVRLAGAVVRESIDWNSQALDLRFRVSDGETELEVLSRGAPPEMFWVPDIEVVLEGRLARNGVFESTNLMVMHSNEYRGAPEGHGPEQRYPELFGDG